MIVACTGAGGFVGRHLVARLTARGHRVRVLARDPVRLPFPSNDVAVVRGALGDRAALAALARGADALIHLVGIIAESGAQTFQAVHVAGTRALLDAAGEAGVRRFLHMSAAGARPDHDATAYHRTKWEAELAVRAAGLAHAVLRPTLVVGPENVPMQLLARLHRLLPAVPVFGDGAFPLEPVWIGDVTEAFARALERPELVGEWNLGGPDRVTYRQFVEAIGRAVGRPRPLLAVPLAAARLAAAAMDVLPAGLAPITSDQLQMLVEGSVAPDNAIASVFGITPLPLKDALERSLAGRSGTVGDGQGRSGQRQRP